MTRARAIAAVAVLAVLGACSDGPSVTPVVVKGGLAKSTLIFAQSKGPILTRIYGATLGQSHDKTVAATLGAIAGIVQSPLLRYTAAPDRAGAPSVTYRLAYGFPKGTALELLCSNDVPPPPAAENERITVAGAFCLGSEMLTGASGWVKNVSGLDDARFRQLLADMTRGILANSEME